MYLAPGQQIAFSVDFLQSRLMTVGRCIACLVYRIDRGLCTVPGKATIRTIQVLARKDLFNQRGEFARNELSFDQTWGSQSVEEVAFSVSSRVSWTRGWQLPPFSDAGAIIGGMAQINSRQLKGIFVCTVVSVNGWVLHVEGVEYLSDLCIMYPSILSNCSRADATEKLQDNGNAGGYICVIDMRCCGAVLMRGSQQITVAGDKAKEVDNSYQQYVAKANEQGYKMTTQDRRKDQTTSREYVPLIDKNFSKLNEPNKYDSFAVLAGEFRFITFVCVGLRIG